MLLHDLLGIIAGGMGERVALIDGEQFTTYAQLDERATSLSAALHAHGVERGDRVATLIENSTDAVVAIWGILRAGAVLVPITPGARGGRIAYILKDCGVKAIIASPESASALSEAMGSGVQARALWTQLPPGHAWGTCLRTTLPKHAHAHAPQTGQIDQDLAAIIYTSGTTGEPKGAMLTHRNLVNTSGVVARYLANSPADVVCCVLPLSFSYGLCQVLAAAHAGYAIQLERSFAFPYDVLKRMAENRATGLPAVPTIFAKLIQLMPLDGIDLTSLRYMTNAAAGIPPAHALRLRELFPSVAFYPMYGQTECTRATFLDPALVDEHPGSSGRAIPNCECYLVDPQGRRLPDGGEGELVVRGANVMRGYWGRPEETAAKLRDGAIAGEKVLHTGDIFRSDADGLLTFVSRTDDIFKCRGEKVSPREIENVLHELREVGEAAVVGVPDEGDGMAIKAVVVPREGATLTELRVRAHCRARLEPGLMPKFVEIRAELPKTDSGKLRRRDLVGG